MELYHVLNRGVDKRTIFVDNQDNARFVHDLFEFNSPLPALNTSRHHADELEMIDIVSRSSRENRLIDLHGWSLMGNHYHLLMSERVEGGLVQFIKKLNIGYAKYFNERYTRSGTLFQGRTKKVHIATDAHLLFILHYIHLNPLDLYSETASWRNGVLSDPEHALALLKSYKWSSFLDYTGNRNFPSILTTSFFNDIFSGDYAKDLIHFVHDMSMSSLGSLTLEQ
jgi:putative transposase